MRILVAVGAGEHGKTAVFWGHLLAQLTGSTPALLTVIKHESERPQREAVLEKAAQLLQSGPTAPVFKIVEGRVDEEIVDEVQAGHYDLLVMGVRPFQPLIKRVFGSVTERVLQQVPCPVLIAKNRSDHLNRILICEGGRDPSLLHRFITKLPEIIRDGTEIKILHVMSQILADPAEKGWELNADADALIEQQTPEGALLQHDVELLSVVSVPVETEVRHGLVVDEIVAEARDGRYDLIVIGRHKNSSWWLADLMDQIVTQADRSVLVI